MPHIKSSVRSSISTALLCVLFCCFLFLGVFQVSHAQIKGDFKGTGGIDGSLTGNGGIDGNDFGDTDSTELMNPLKSKTLVGFLLDLIDILILFAIPLIVLMIIYAGFLYVMARGNEEQVTKATRALTYAIIGGLLILGAKLLLEIIEGTVDQLVR